MCCVAPATYVTPLPPPPQKKVNYNSSNTKLPGFISLEDLLKGNMSTAPGITVVSPTDCARDCPLLGLMGTCVESLLGSCSVSVATSGVQFSTATTGGN